MLKEGVYMSAIQPNSSSSLSQSILKRLIVYLIVFGGVLLWVNSTTNQEEFQGVIANSDSATMNGFDISNLTIPAKEVLSGGPPRDGIPALFSPKFIPTQSVNYLNDNDIVISFTHNKETKAYPLKILLWHEIANDTVGGKSVAVTYCPLCGTSMVFDRSYKGKTHSYGVSGLLYNSDVLMYDKETESLWSQLKMEAVSGPMVGQKFTWLPSTEMTWAAWKSKYPSAAVLSLDTGHRRNYAINSYQGYQQSDTIMFPVPINRKEQPLKSWVIGIRMGDTYKAYPLENLSKTDKSVLSDTIGDTPIKLYYDPTDHTVQVVNEITKATIPHVKLYWFAWQAFYPDTEIYTPTQ